MSDNLLKIQSLYVSYFNRPADPAGLKYWNDVLTSNPGSLKDIARTFALSAEFRLEHADDSNREIVEEIYENLFGRDPETGGLNYWTDLLDRKVITIDNVATHISSAAIGLDKVIFDGKVAAANLFTQRLDLPREQAAYQGNAALDLAEDFLETIKDQASLTTALATDTVDFWISRIVTGNPFGSDVVLVGVQTDAEPVPLF